MLTRLYSVWEKLCWVFILGTLFFLNFCQWFPYRCSLHLNLPGASIEDAASACSLNLLLGIAVVLVCLSPWWTSLGHWSQPLPATEKAFIHIYIYIYINNIYIIYIYSIHILSIFIPLRWDCEPCIRRSFRLNRKSLKPATTEQPRIQVEGETDKRTWEAGW